MEHVDNFQTSDPTIYRDFFNTEAETWCLSTCDYRMCSGVGADYTAIGENGNDVHANFTTRADHIQSCKTCLESCSSQDSSVSMNNQCVTSVCEVCLVDQEVCNGCCKEGYTHWRRECRPCDSCIRKGEKCTKLLLLAHVMDCEEKNYQALKKINADPSSITVGLPDLPHHAKTLDQSSANWFFFLDGSRFN